MAPICGLCEEEMADLDFHLEGKCQAAIIEACVKDPGFNQAEVQQTAWIVASETFGTEACNHRCHLPKDGNLQFGFEHPRHCCTCDGSKPIPATRCDRDWSDARPICWGYRTEGPHNIILAPIESPLPLLSLKQDPYTSWDWRITWDIVDEAASPFKDINWAIIDANFPPVKSWACKRGHNYRGSEVKWAVTDGEGKTATSGPLCPLCVLDFLNREFPTFEVKDG